jgi:hypothetical protein
LTGGHSLPVMERKVYRSPWTLRTVLLLGALVAAGLGFGVRPSESGHWVWLGLAVVALPVLLRSVFWGATATRDGLVLREAFVTRRLVWSDVASIRVVHVRARQDSWAPVFRLRPGGRTVRSMVLAQPNPGAAEDLVAELNSWRDGTFSVSPITS